MIPILGELTPGTTQRHLVKLPGAALANDEPRPVISVAGAKPGPVLFVNAGVHGGESAQQVQIEIRHIHDLHVYHTPHQFDKCLPCA